MAGSPNKVELLVRKTCAPGGPIEFLGLCPQLESHGGGSADRRADPVMRILVRFVTENMCPAAACADTPPLGRGFDLIEQFKDGHPESRGNDVQRV